MSKDNTNRTPDATFPILIFTIGNVLPSVNVK